MSRAIGLILLVGCVVGLVSLPHPVGACAVVWPKNKPVSIASESAIIVWDASSKTEHFIRRASFSTTAEYFGFLVPTPGKPTLSETDDDTFVRLAKITAPKVVTMKRPSGGGCFLACGDEKPAATAGKATVEVLEEGKNIAGHDYAILAAKDSQALNDWLQTNNYQNSPALAEWVKPYLDEGWVITAFKFSSTNHDLSSVGTKAVHMTFATEKPVYPYKEPRQASGVDGAMPGKPSRLLRVYFLSDKKYRGTLGDKGEWPGQTAWAGALSQSDREDVWKALNLPAGKTPQTWWLTEFEDYSSPRPGTADVFFAPSEDQTPLQREKYVHYVSQAFPDCIPWCAALGCLLAAPIVRRWRRQVARR